MRLSLDKQKSQSQSYTFLFSEWECVDPCPVDGLVRITHLVDSGKVVSGKPVSGKINLDIPARFFDYLLVPAQPFPLGEFIKSRMQGLGYSQHDLAFKCGISQMTISKIVRGVTRSVNSKTLQKLAIGLQVEEDILKQTLSVK